MLRYIAKILLFTLLIYSKLHAQVFVEKDLEDGIAYMVNFILSDEFNSLKQTNTDLDLVDTLYLRALHFHNYAIDEALLTLTFATLPFREMPLHIPFTNIELGAKLPSGPEGTLEKKINRLPGQVFIDTPQTKFGDKDKVAHFFGNAFFSYSVTIFNISKFLSILVELFEDAFKVEGTIDHRDFIANYLGYHFGRHLKDDEDYLPSEAFKLYTFFKLNYNY